MDVPAQMMIPEDDLKRMSKSINAICLPETLQTADAGGSRELKATLNSLLETAYALDISMTHRMAACNTTCAFIERCLAFTNLSIHLLVCDDDVWRKLFDIYLVRYDHAKPKSMRQVLVTLIKLLVSVTASSNPQARTQAIERLLNIVFNHDETTRVKAAIHALAHFVNKNFVTTNYLLSIFESCTQKVEQPFYRARNKKITKFFIGIFDWIPYAEVATATGHLAMVMLASMGNVTSHRATSELYDDRPALWAEALAISVNRHQDHVQSFKQHLFPVLFKNKFSNYVGFLQYLRFEDRLQWTRQLSEGASRSLDTFETELLLCALQVGKELGLVMEANHRVCTSVQVRSNEVRISNIVVGQLMSQASDAVRLSSLSILAFSPYTTKPYTSETLSCVRHNLPHLFAENDSNFRGEVAGLVQYVVDRLRTASAALHRETIHLSKDAAKIANIRNCDSLQPQDLINVHRKFLVWLLKFSCNELGSTASYQRHISGLKTIEILVLSGLDSKIPTDRLSRQARDGMKWPFTIEIIGFRMHRELCDLLLDPFDDVRALSTSILKIAQPSTSPREKSEKVDTLRRAQNLMLSSGRMDHADGVARLYDLLGTQITCKDDFPDHKFQKEYGGVLDIVYEAVSSIDKALRIAKSHLSAAVSSYPIHGHLISLRYLFENTIDPVKMTQNDVKGLKSTISSIFGSIVQIWDLVNDLLCNDAPEGYMPDNFDDEPDLSTKDILSYAWRGLKEASLLMRVMVLSNARWSKRLPNFGECDLKVLGDLCFWQLSDLRHRGAFSTVSQTFAIICNQCRSSSDPLKKELIDDWYKRSLSLIKASGSRITRRSAGIPALITGILSAEPSAPLFDIAMQDLKTLSDVRGLSNREISDLPQVHALNCLKNIFTTTKLAARSERYVAASLNVAIECLISDIWAIRNCGLMLFRSLIDRMLGSTGPPGRLGRTANLSRLSYHDYPGLLDFVMRLLRSEYEVDTGRKRLIDRHAMQKLPVEAIFPVLDLLTRTSPPGEYQEEIRKLLLHLTSNPQWHVRDMAARAFAAASGLEDAVALSKSFRVTSLQTQNSLHGRLLCLKHILREASKGSGHLKPRVFHDLYPLIKDLAETILIKNRCNITKAAYIDILNFFGSCNLRSVQKDHFLPVLSVRWLGQLSKIDQFCTTILLRRSAALYMLLEFLFSIEGDLVRIEHLQNTIMHSANTDPEAIANALESVSEELFDVPNLAQSRLIRLCSLLVAESQSPSIRLIATRAISKCLIHYTPSKHPKSDYLLPHLAKFDVKANFEAVPSIFNDRLSLWGYCLHAKLSILGKWTGQLTAEATAWLSLVGAALGNLNNLEARYAAAVSLKGFQHLFFSEISALLPADVYLTFFLHLHTTLTDDDDEIRLLGANTTTQILFPTSTSSTLTPPIAAYLLTSHLTKRFTFSTTLATNAVARLTATPHIALTARTSVTNIELIPTRIQLKQATKTVLHVVFSVERQNLYFDPVQASKQWRRVLIRLSPSTLSNPLGRALTSWILEALDTMVKLADGEEKDGPLGWGSDADVYAITMRVICAADVMLRWSLVMSGEASALGIAKMADVTSMKSSSIIEISNEKLEAKKVGEEIRRRLVILWKAAVRARMHESLMEELWKVLRRNVVGRMRKLAGLMKVVEDGLVENFECFSAR